jgi:hypothetical protein
MKSWPVLVVISVMGASTNAVHAAPVLYEITFGPNSLDPNGGTGSFIWDDSTRLLSNLRWDFGPGPLGSGGVDDNLYPWSGPIFSGTQSEWAFEVLTDTDMVVEGCSSGQIVSCGVIFLGDFLFGGFSGFEFHLNNGEQQIYNASVPGFPAVTGTFSTRRITGVQPADIDIKPGSDSNSTNPRSKGVIPVAVLGSASFDATQVDSSTVQFGPGNAPAVRDGIVTDINNDGFPDMLLHFRTKAAAIQCGNTSASLSGMTFNGQRFTGSDSIRTVGCK